MTRATRSHQYSGEARRVLYVAFELGVSEWKVGFTPDPGTKPRVRVMPARDLRRLTREIAEAKKWWGLPAAAPVRSCYEAGRTGSGCTGTSRQRRSTTWWWTQRASR